MLNPTPGRETAFHAAATAARSRDGVIWSNRFGGICPLCRRVNCRVTSSPPWDGPVKLRKHRCACGHTFKSTDYDPTEIPEKPTHRRKP